MIKAVIFDMDGLLIDSEPLWWEAEIETAKIAGLNLKREQVIKTSGLRVDKVVDFWYNIEPWKNPSKKELADALVADLVSRVKDRGVEMPGTKQILEMMKKKDVKVALASSSVMPIINAVVEKLGIREYFKEIYSAEFEEHGKPHPGVYMTTAKMLDIAPEQSLAFEDSFNGLLAAKSAGMKCVCIPNESLEGSSKLAIADLVLPSLSDFTEENWKKLES